MADLLSDSFVKRFFPNPKPCTFFCFCFWKRAPSISSPNVLKRRRRHTKRNKTTFEENDDDDDKGAMKKSSGGSFQNLQGKHEEEEEETSFFVERISRVLAHTKPHQKVPFD